MANPMRSNDLANCSLIAGVILPSLGSAKPASFNNLRICKTAPHRVCISSDSLPLRVVSSARKLTGRNIFWDATHESLSDDTTTSSKITQ